MKKKISLVMVFALILAFTTGVVAKNVFDIIKAEVRTDFVVKIDGEDKIFKNVDGDRVYPILHDGTTYLPLRAIGEIMNKDVYWYEDDKVIELKDKATTTVTDADVIVDENKKNEDNKPPKADDSKKTEDNKPPKADDSKKTEDNKPPKADDSKYIGVDKAKKIALKKAGLKETDVSFIKVELDSEKGTPVYDVEFRQGYKEYNAEIKATDGTIVEWDVDLDD